MKNKIILIAVFCASCSSALPSVKPYHVDVQQGNVVDAKMMAQLRPGMSKSQVRYILGTPLLQDSFHQNRWDYFYQMRKDGQISEQRRVIVDFENDQLKGVRGDVVPAGSVVAADAPLSDAEKAKANVAAAEKKKGIFDGLKFWESTDNTKQLAKPVVQSKLAPEAVNPDLVNPVQIAVVTEVPEAKTAEVVTSSLAETPAETRVAESRDEVKAAEAAAPMANSPVPVAALAPLVVVPMNENPASAAKHGKTVKSSAKQTAVSPVVAAATPVEPEVESVIDEKVAVTQVVSAWADAWRKKDVKTYLAAYSEKFVPDDLPSKKAWIAQRKQRLSKPGAIGVDLQNVNVDVTDHLATVTFDQDYTSTNYSDHVGKTLKLVKTNEHWMIVKESVTGNASSAAIKAKANVDEPVINSQPTSETDSSTQVEAQDPVAMPAEPTASEPMATSGKSPVTENNASNEPPAKNDSQENNSQQNKPSLFERMLEKIGF